MKLKTMILKNDEFTINVLKFGDRIGWNSEYNGTEYGGYATLDDNITNEEAHQVIIQNAIATLLAVKTGNKDHEYTEEGKKVNEEFLNILKDKLKNK